ncbi:MAG: DUF2254 domain-containing protein [Chloroflexia bacterium]|nr:DUF2254 domain-containing protein [Chloroflexia bacterium]
MTERILSKLSPRLEAWWADTRSTLWFLPTCATILGVLLSSLAIYLDDYWGLTTAGIDSPWLFGAGADGARGVLSSIAGSLVTVIGTVFSITIVALQLASSQFTPRVLRQFTSDRINQTVLAVFIGTFIYALLVLRSVRSSTDAGPGFVPVIGVTVAILLALACMGLLILFIHHMAQQTQVSYILSRASDDALALIDAFFRDEIDVTPNLTRRDYAQGEGEDVLSSSSGYLQRYDYDYLLGAARDHDLTIRMLAPVGAYLNTRQPIARIWSSNQESADLEVAGNHVRSALVTGPERTLNADIALGVRQIVDIAIKGLSPGINDPTTASQALDRVSEVLGRAGALAAPERILYLDDRPAVFLPRIDFEELANIAFTQVRHFGKQDVVVMLHLVNTIERVSSLVDENHHEALIRHLRLVRAAGQQGLELGPDREALCHGVDEAIRRIGEYREGNRTPVVPDIVQEI